FSFISFRYWLNNNLCLSTCTFPNLCALKHELLLKYSCWVCTYRCSNIQSLICRAFYKSWFTISFHFFDCSTVFRTVFFDFATTCLYLHLLFYISLKVVFSPLYPVLTLLQLFLARDILGTSSGHGRDTIGSNIQMTVNNYQLTVHDSTYKPLLGSGQLAVG